MGPDPRRDANNPLEWMSEPRKRTLQPFLVARSMINTRLSHCFRFRSQWTVSRLEACFPRCRQRFRGYKANTVNQSLVLIASLCLLFPPLSDPLKYILPILVNLQLRNHDLARRYAQWCTCPIRLFSRDSLKVNDVFETVNRGDLAFAAFVGTTNYGDFVIFADRDGANL